MAEGLILAELEKLKTSIHDLVSGQERIETTVGDVQRAVIELPDQLLQQGVERKESKNPAHNPFAKKATTMNLNIPDLNYVTQTDESGLAGIFPAAHESGLAGMAPAAAMQTNAIHVDIASRNLSRSMSASPARVEAPSVKDEEITISSPWMLPPEPDAKAGPAIPGGSAPPEQNGASSQAQGNDKGLADVVRSNSKPSLWITTSPSLKPANSSSKPATVPAAESPTAINLHVLSERQESGGTDLLSPVVSPSLGGWHLKPRVHVTGSGISGSRRKMREVSASQTGTLAYVSEDSRPVVETHANGFMRRKSLFPLRPDDPFRLAMDILSMALLFYDSVMIPYIIAWEEPLRNTWLGYVTLASLIFWSTDLLLGFATCVSSADTLVDSWTLIAIHYLKTRFTLDFITVAIDWVAMITEYTYQNATAEQATMLRLVRMLRITRMFRVLAMLRTGRFAQVYDILFRKAHAADVGLYVTFFINVVRLVAIVLWLNHLGCCLWFILVKHIEESTDTGGSWAQILKTSLNVTSFVDSSQVSQSYQYLIGFYWSVTAMFSGESQLEPGNSMEAAFSLLFVIFGMLFGSSLISSVAAMLVEFQTVTRDKTEKMRTLRRYLQQHHVDPVLSVSIQQQVASRMTVEKRLSDQDVLTLSLLSVRLRVALKHNIYSSIFADHMFFRICDYMDDEFIQDVCAMAITHRPAQPGEEIFGPGQHMEQAFVVTFGKLQYTATKAVGKLQANGTCESSSGKRLLRKSTTQFLKDSDLEDALLNLPSDSGPVELAKNDWLCEIALFARWVTLGSGEALSMSEVAHIAVAGLGQALRNHPDVAAIIKDYCVTLCQAIEKEKPYLSDLDLDVDRDIVVAAMPTHSRLMMSTPALKTVDNSSIKISGRKPNLRDSLYSEVEAGKCNLRQDCTGRLLRVIQLVALQLKLPDGRMCVRLAEQKGAVTSSAIALPGTKIRLGELPGDALHRLLEGLLATLSPGISIHSKAVEVEEKMSPAYGMHTKYIRTVFHCELKLDGVDIPVSEMVWERSESDPHLERQADSVETFVLGPTDDTFTLFGWMEQEDYNVLSSSATSKAMVEEWMGRARASVAQPLASRESSKQMVML